MGYISCNCYGYLLVVVYGGIFLVFLLDLDFFLIIDFIYYVDLMFLFESLSMYFYR